MCQIDRLIGLLQLMSIIGILRSIENLYLRWFGIFFFLAIVRHLRGLTSGMVRIKIFKLSVYKLCFVLISSKSLFANIIILQCLIISKFGRMQFLILFWVGYFLKFCCLAFAYEHNKLFVVWVYMLLWKHIC